MGQKLTGKQLRMMKRRAREQQQRPREPETEKEILDRIHELEYRRAILPKFVHHPRYPIIEETLTNEIKRLYNKLDALKKQEQKPNAPNA